MNFEPLKRSVGDTNGGEAFAVTPAVTSSSCRCIAFTFKNIVLQMSSPIPYSRLVPISHLQLASVVFQAMGRTQKHVSCKQQRAPPRDAPVTMTTPPSHKRTDFETLRIVKSSRVIHIGFWDVEFRRKCDGAMGSGRAAGASFIMAHYFN